MVKQIKVVAVCLSACFFSVQPAWSQSVQKQHDPIEKYMLEVQTANLPDSNCLNQNCQPMKKDPLPAMALNLLPLGFGSYQQGDLVGGIALSTIDGLGLGFLTFAGIQALSGNSWGAAFMAPGSIVLLSLGRVLGLIFPWIHSFYFNQAPASETHASPELGRETALNTTPFIAYSVSF